MRNIKFDRRSLLRGLGYGTVLCSGLSKSLYAQTLPGRFARLAMFAYANGSHPDSNHMMATGETFTLTPHMAPLEPMKSQIVIVKRATLERGSGNSHKSTSFSVFGLGSPTSFDQMIADKVKATTPIPSLEYSIGVTTGGGGVIPGLSQRNGSFLPGLRTPVAFYQKVAERVTGGAPPPPTTGNPTPPMTSPTTAEGALLRRKSLLDWVKGDVTTFRSRLGAEEQKKFDAYAESLRTLERDIGSNVPGGGGGEPIKPSASCTKIAAPGTTFSTMTRVNDMPVQNKLYLDTIAMAFACNVTRVASAMWGGGQSDEPVRFADINMGNWHSTSHNDPRGGGGQQMIKVQAFMAGELLYFMNKLRTYADGQFSLLDNTMAVLSTQNGCSTQVAFAPMDHPKQNCPLIIGGGAAGAWKPGKVVDANGRNHNDAYLSIAQVFDKSITTVGNAAWCKGPLIT